MLSRLADAIYWMNRYIERAENYARFIDANYNLLLEMPPDMAEQWKPLVVATGDWSLYQSLYDDTSKEHVVNFLVFDINNPNSICNSVIRARENARVARPEITKEVWEQVNHLYHMVKDLSGEKAWKKKDPRNFFNEIKKGCQLLNGIFDATITRNDGWHFGKAGQFLERADKTSRVLDVKYHIILPSADSVGSPFDLIQWAALLKSVSAYDMYRKKYGKLTSKDIAEFLILDKQFPRSILRCLLYAEQSLHTISGRNGSGYTNNAEKHLGQVRSRMEYTDISYILDYGMHEYLDDIQKQLNLVSNSVFKTFFAIDSQIQMQQ
ncbi:MAG: alpha-E domain-containing protein [Cyclobacteriaceae bacterium]